MNPSYIKNLKNKNRSLDTNRRSINQFNTLCLQNLIDYQVLDNDSIDSLLKHLILVLPNNQHILSKLQQIQ